MGFFDRHVSVRIARGLERVAATKAKFDNALELAMSDTDRDKQWSRLFPLNEQLDPPAREPAVSVRSSYRTTPSDATIPAVPTARASTTAADVPSIIVDLVDEATEKRSLGRSRLERETVEILITGSSKDDVRCLHQLVKEILEDSSSWFKSLGYATVVADGPSGDLRPADGAIAGLPNLLGAFSRYLRVSARISRTTTRIFTDPSDLVDPSSVRVNHMDAHDDHGNPGAVKPDTTG